MSDVTLNEWKMTAMGKLFSLAAGAWLLGKLTRLKIKGSTREVELLTKALIASKRFQEELKKPGATADSVIDKLNIKNLTAKNFQDVTGVPWPL